MYIEEWSHNPNRGIHNPNLPSTDFYKKITVLNDPVYIVMESLE